MSSTKRSKRDGRVVAYIRINAKEHAQVSKIAAQRGHPHTFASVAAEMISKALKMENREQAPAQSIKRKSSAKHQALKESSPCRTPDR